MRIRQLWVELGINIPRDNKAFDADPGSSEDRSLGQSRQAGRASRIMYLKRLAMACITIILERLLRKPKTT
jgi:hypothetical protein